MVDFMYNNPTEIIFGKDKENGIGEVLKRNSISRVLMIYGGGSIKRNGLYDRVTTSLSNAGIEWDEYGGIKSNPRVSDVDKASEAARGFNAEAVLSVGGGSVMDTGKAVAAATIAGCPVWDFFQGKPIREALPIFNIVTIAATASEMNAGFVLSNKATGEKFGIGSPFLHPRVSILNPVLTYSVSKDYTAYSAVDILSHVLEGYLTCTNEPVLMNYFVEGIIKTVIESTEIILQEPENYKARAEFMWAATMALNGTTKRGVEGVSSPNHMIEHGLSAVTDIAHGAGLAIVIPAWAKWYYKNNIPQFERLARIIFKKQTAEEGIIDLESWFKKIGAPTRLSDAGIKENQLDSIVEKAYLQGAFWGMDKDYPMEAIKTIMQEAI